LNIKPKLESQNLYAGVKKKLPFVYGFGGRGNGNNGEVLLGILCAYLQR